jgi:hypothetical protein
MHIQLQVRVVGEFSDIMFDNVICRNKLWNAIIKKTAQNHLKIPVGLTGKYVVLYTYRVMVMMKEVANVNPPR